ncbi:hypothetical protein J2X65_000685 [Ancylobacter sp. 3268]|nr:hypothetical protein [Ancylobacter sp. 3268]
MPATLKYGMPACFRNRRFCEQRTARNPGSHFPLMRTEESGGSMKGRP